MNPLESIVDALEALGYNPRPNGPSAYQARCPAHDDQKPSLDLSEGNEGRALIICRAGCDTKSVMDALGLPMSALFPPKPEQAAPRVVTATYDYTDETGTLLYQVDRRSDKTFEQRPVSGKRGKGCMDGVRLVLYRLPLVMEAIEHREPVYVVEGEKDVHAIEKAGYVATCNPRGAGKWRTEYAQSLAGASQVVIVADNDEPGLAHARTVQQSLNGTPNRIVRAAKGKDAADHLAAGLTVDDFLDAPTDEEPAPEQPEPKSDPLKKTVQLRNAATQYRRKNITWLPGYEGFIPIGMLTLIAGLQGFGKSLLSCLIAAQETRAGRVVCIASAEDSPEHIIIPRLEAVGANLDLCRIVVLTIGEADEELRLPAHTELLSQAILEARPSVLVVDPISAYLGSNIDSWKDTDVRSALRPLSDLALEAELALLVIAHLNKGNGSTDYLQRVAGNMAFTAAARSSLLFGADPTDPEGENGSQRILALGKSNLAARNTRARQYRIDTVHLSAIPEEDIEATTAPKLTFLADVDISDRQILAGPGAIGSDKVKEAIAFLLECLAECPRERPFVEAAAEAEGITHKNLRSARERVGVLSVRQGFGAPALWSLPARTKEPE